MKLRYAVEIHGNETMASLHVSVKLHTGEYGSSIQPNVLTPELKNLMAMLRAVDGVEHVESIKQHGIRFTVSPIFDREQVMNRAMAIFCSWHGTAMSQWEKGKTIQPPKCNRY